MTDTTCETCSTCYYYRPNTSQHGHCRIHPPIPRDTHPNDYDTPFDPEGCWPAVQAHDWCGEYSEPRTITVELEDDKPRTWTALLIALATIHGSRLIRTATRRMQKV